MWFPKLRRNKDKTKGKKSPRMTMYEHKKGRKPKPGRLKQSTINRR